MKTYKKIFILLLIIGLSFFIGYKLNSSKSYKEGFSKAFDVNEKIEDLSKTTPTPYIENKKQETIIEDDLVPQCSYDGCPEYKTFDVDDDGKPETIVSERTAMTQQAGRIWVIDDGKVVFKSNEMAQISVAPKSKDPDEQGNGFIISYATESPTAGEKVFKDSFKKDYYLFKDGKYILEKRTYQNTPKVAYYAKVKQVSTSGDIRFYWYDTELKQIKDADNQYAWFFALPKDVPDNDESTNKWVKFIKENQDSVFKITGTKEDDDCNYYGSDNCIENIDIKNIEIVK